jgi:chemotaxis signal transduction protein
MTVRTPTNERVAALRDAFDRTFASPPVSPAEVLDSLIEIRISGDPYGLRVADIQEIAKDRKIVPLPSAVPHLIGLAGIRGGLVPIYSLAALLGYARGADAPRWLALCGREEPVGLAFDELDGYVRVTAGSAETARPVIDVGSVIAKVKSLIGERRSSNGELAR